MTIQHKANFATHQDGIVRISQACSQPMVSVVKALCTLGRFKSFLYICGCPSVTLAWEQCFVFIRRGTAMSKKKMLTGKSSKLSLSQCVRLGCVEIPKVRRLPNVRIPQIQSIGGFEGERVISIGGPSICLLRAGTSGHAVVELTSSRIDSPPRRVGNQNSPNNDNGADVVDPMTGGISVNDLKAAGSRVRLESTEGLMHILAIGESALQSESNRFSSHKARSRVDKDRLEDLVTAADLAWMGSFEVIMNRPEPLEHRHIEVVLVDVRIRRQELVVDRVRLERVARGRTAGLQLLPFIDENIPSERNLAAPMSSILVSAFERNMRYFEVRRR